MSRPLGAEDHAVFDSNEYRIVIDDSIKLRVSTSGSTDVAPVLSASTATTTLDRSQKIILVDASAAEMGLTLPSAADVGGQTYIVKKIDVSANAVLLSGAAATETIDGEVFQTVGEVSGSISVVSDGALWHVVAAFSGGDTL